MAPDEGYLSTSELAERYPSPGLHLTMQSDLSHKGRGERSVPFFRVPARMSYRLAVSCSAAVHEINSV
jgi:hypothetical protein